MTKFNEMSNKELSAVLKEVRTHIEFRKQSCHNSISALHLKKYNLEADLVDSSYPNHYVIEDELEEAQRDMDLQYKILNDLSGTVK